jgi:hypothetical protein
MEGSCMITTPTWIALTDPQGNAITKTANAIETILENPYQIRPNCTEGDAATDVDVYIVVKRN